VTTAGLANGGRTYGLIEEGGGRWLIGGNVGRSMRSPRVPRERTGLKGAARDTIWATDLVDGPGRWCEGGTVRAGRPSDFFLSSSSLFLFS
jgi:hypothetical protein